MVSSRRVFRYFLILFLIALISFVLIGFQFLSEDEDKEMDDDYIDYGEEPRIPLHDEMELLALKPDKINQPIILWWTPFTGEKGRYKTCGDNKCFFSVNRHLKDHPKTQVFMFYGSDMKMDDLPLPRLPHHEWALFHEESPKNSYYFSHADVMTMFNHTCTFRRESDYPITTQYLISLDWLQSMKYVVPVKEKNEWQAELGSIIYTHSDCDPPSDRDSYVKILMDLVQVDAYGKCLHNKNIPDHLSDPIKGMDHVDFYKLVAKYKFSLAMENGVCPDYVTEKLWRPLMVGSVPIVYGSPTVRDLLPSNHSAIIINDFKSVKELAAYLKYLDNNDDEYNKYLEWKKTGVTNPILLKILKNREWSIDSGGSWSPTAINFIDGFECFVCKRVHENIQRKKRGRRQKNHMATFEHYGCPKPTKFSFDGNKQIDDMNWQSEWELHGKMAKTLRHFIDHNIKYDVKSILEESFKEMH
ncbi:alpha-(1,3)-fucosyltransferase 10 [Patella vulgata]|uniref:alpha-(1,3)-fucosyltransferase 10 n=1 Tax=Patella vulgata TaxID=6465 RepID=UPI0021801BC3|nr:alpha-(1,3)-fucosyltransferase 10 [Patella vulgata]